MGGSWCGIEEEGGGLHSASLATLEEEEKTMEVDGEEEGVGECPLNLDGPPG